MGREAWRAGVHGVTKSRTRLSDRTKLTQRSATIDFSTLLLLLAGGRLPIGEYIGEQSLGFQKTVLTGVVCFLIKGILQSPFDDSILKNRCETGITSHPWGAPASGSCVLYSCNHILLVCLNPPCVWVTDSQLVKIVNSLPEQYVKNKIKPHNLGGEMKGQIQKLTFNYLVYVAKRLMLIDRDSSPWFPRHTWTPLSLRDRKWDCISLN